MKEMQKCGLPEHEKKARPGSMEKRTGWDNGNAEYYSSRSLKTFLNHSTALQM